MPTDAARGTGCFRQPRTWPRGPRLPRGGGHRLRMLFDLHPIGGGGVSDVAGDVQAAPVLIVDDERAIRTICRVNLEAAGMRVLEADDGEAALRVAAAERPSVVLLDVMMPGLDGWHVARKLGEGHETREIPVVFLSARAEPADRHRAHEVGAVGYIVKPFDPLVLGDMLNDILDRIRRGEREHLRQALVEES